MEVDDANPSEHSADDLPHVTDAAGSELATLYHAGKVKRETKGLENVSNISLRSASAIVPPSLQTLLAFILCGDNAITEEDRPQILNIDQNIVFAQDRRKLTPKHVGLASAIHESTRSED